MAIIGGLDVHRSQITYDWVDPDSGQHRRGRLAPATREHLRVWLQQFQDRPAAFALEGCTGWRYVVEELQRAGIAAHLAEPADTSALRGPKRRAKTDRLDARHLRELLAAGRLPESWIPPAQVLEVRTRVRCYKALLDEHTAWLQRIHATLFHHGVPAERDLLAPHRRARLEQGSGLSPAARQLVTVALRALDHLDAELDRLRRELVWFARRQPGCRALDALYGIGPLAAVAIWAELGDVRRFTSSRFAVRHTGLDITVWSSDGKRTPGHLARQGPPVLRWALFEAAKTAARASSPDHAYYLQVKGRLGGNRATLAVARKLTRRCYHTLGALGDQAFAPVVDPNQLGRWPDAMWPVRALPTPLMSRGQLPRVSCRPVSHWPALKERAAAPAWGITPSSITSPDPGSADQDKAGRPSARASAASLPAACLGVVPMR